MHGRAGGIRGASGWIVGPLTLLDGSPIAVGHRAVNEPRVEPIRQKRPPALDPDQLEAPIHFCLHCGLYKELTNVTVDLLMGIERHDSTLHRVCRRLLAWLTPIVLHPMPTALLVRNLADIFLLTYNVLAYPSPATLRKISEASDEALSSTTADGQTLMHFLACVGGRLMAHTAFERLGNDELLSAKDSFGMTPLMYAISYGFDEVLSYSWPRPRKTPFGPLVTAKSCW